MSVRYPRRRRDLEEDVGVVPGSTGTDTYGDPVPADPGGSRTVPGCLVEWPRRGSTESAALGRNGVLIDVVVYFPAGTRVLRTDQLVVRGVRYDVEGEPGDWRVGVVVTARRAEG